MRENHQEAQPWGSVGGFLNSGRRISEATASEPGAVLLLLKEHFQEHLSSGVGGVEQVRGRCSSMAVE